ncbi:MAG TPA: BTAD domain-containing putative transcriptional regulator [Acidothermaceae bacterium]
MRIELLGPLDVRVGESGSEHAVELAGARLRGLLIRLAVDAPRPTSAATLVDALWGDEPPLDPANALQSLVSRLRRGLGDSDLVQQVPGGYRLSAERDDVDLHRFTDLARDGREALRRGQLEAAAGLLRDALAVWHGPTPESWGDTTDSVAHQTMLCEQRLDVTADLIEAEIALGHHGDVVAELELLAAQFPLRERVIGLLMRALAGAGRQAEALARYEKVRRDLSDELGVDPSAELQATHLALLRGELDTVAANTRDAATDAARSPARRTNVKTALTSFVGRDDEIARIGKLLSEVRLITLVGPGGAGKTRLASVAVTAVLDRVPDGVWMVELAPVTDPADVPSAVLDALDVREAALVDLARPTVLTSMRDVTTRLVDALADRECVLLLDNCEHVIDAAARLADDLLAQCASLRIVTTSREPLGIVGETLVTVPPLPQPAVDAYPEDALAHPAVLLFADRAVAVQPDFVVDARTVAPVIEIVRRLDGLPLAIELAAARLRTLPVDEIAARLTDRFRLLTGGSRTAVPRHRTLRAVVEWSWDLLSVPERLLAERLAVFAGTIATADAIAVCADDQLGSDDIDDLLDSLVDKSLLQASALAGTPRYRMLETLREFGLERLTAHGEVGDMRRRHAARFSELVREAGPHTRTAGQLPWMARLEDERDNILAALRFLCEDDQAQAALEVAVEMATYWMFSGRHADASSWLEFALQAKGDAAVITRLGAEALQRINSVASSFTRPPDEVETSLASLRDLGERIDAVEIPPDSFLFMLRPVIAMFADDRDAVDRLVNEGLASTDAWVAASLRMFRAAMAENNGDVATMRSDVQIALAQFRALGERWGQASCLGILGQLKTMDGDLDGAIAAIEEAISLSEELGGHDDAIMMNIRLADLRMRTGDIDGARASVAKMQELTDLSALSHQAIVISLVRAEIALFDGDLDQARRLRDECLRRISQVSEVHPAQGHIAAIVLAFAARLSLEAGDLDTARDNVARAYRYARGTKDMPIVAMIGVTAAAAARAEGRLTDAAELLGASASLRGAADATQPEIAKLTARLTKELGATVFIAAYGSARDLDLEAACARLDAIVAPL